MEDEFNKAEKQEETNIGYWEQVLDTPTEEYKNLFVAEKEYIKKNIPENSFVLDVGCGEGRNMESIFEKTSYIVGVDNDQKAVDDASKRFSSIDSVEVILADVKHLPFKDETFDVITLLMVLVNIEIQKELALYECSRVLKKDGFIIMSTFSETAFEERMKVYKMVNAPIKEIQGTKVIFDESLGSHTSEQFSLEELRELGRKANLQMVDFQKVGNLAYICKFIKVN